MKVDVKAEPCKIEINIPANPKLLCIVRQATQKVAEIMGMEVNDINAVTLAVEEALTNVIRHGYGGCCEDKIIITYELVHASDTNCGQLHISIRDFGKQIDPDDIHGRNLNELRPGGLGVHIIKSVMDGIEYVPQKDGGMLLSMHKVVDKTNYTHHD